MLSKHRNRAQVKQLLSIHKLHVPAGPSVFQRSEWATILNRSVSRTLKVNWALIKDNTPQRPLLLAMPTLWVRFSAFHAPDTLHALFPSALPAPCLRQTPAKCLNLQVKLICDCSQQQLNHVHLTVVSQSVQENGRHDAPYSLAPGASSPGIRVESYQQGHAVSYFSLDTWVLAAHCAAWAVQTSSRLAYNVNTPPESPRQKLLDKPDETAVQFATYSSDPKREEPWHDTNGTFLRCLSHHAQSQSLQ